MRLGFLAVLAAAATLIIPSAAQAFGCGDTCAGPAISTATTSVTVAEGSTATVTGTWSNGDIGGVTMSASAGSLDVGTGVHGGTWTWTWTPQDGPAQSRTVTISVGGGDSIDIPVTVNDVAPSATGLSAPAHATTNTPFTVSLTGATDPSPVDAANLGYAFDCGTGIFGAFGSSSSASCSIPGEGFRTVRGEVRDPDGAISGAYSQVVGVFNAVTVTEGQSASKSFASVGPVCAVGSQPGTGSASVIGSALSWSASTTDGPQTTPVAFDVELPVAGACLGSAFDTHRTIRFDLVVNNAPPTATFSAPAIARANTAVPISLSSPTDPSPADRAAGYRYSFDCGSGFGALGTSTSASCPGAASGTIAVKGRVYDKDDDFTEYTASVPVDGSNPDTAIATKPAALDNDATPSFTWSGSDPGGSVAGYAYRVDNGAWSGFDPATGVTLAALGDGQHTFEVKARDAAGNEDATPDSYTWVIDTAAPDTSITSQPAAVSPPTQTQTQAQGASNLPATTKCKVPNLKKKKLAAATSALARAHCKLGKVKKKRVKGLKHGLVASQSARAGANLAPGAKVNVVLAR